MIRLTIKQGSIVQMLSVDADKVFVGRLETNGVRLEDPTVSRKHCMIRRTNKGGLEVLDLNSHHGTRKNGESVERAGLEIGDEVGVGAFSILVEDPAAAAVAPAKALPGVVTPGAPPGRPAREGKDLLSAANRSTFSEQLYLQFRRLPWWAASLCLHTFLVYLLFAVSFQPQTRATPFGSISGKISEDFGSESDSEVSEGDEILSREPEPDVMPFPTFDENEPSPATDAVIPEDETPDLREIGPSLDVSSAPLARKGNTSAPVIPEAEFGKDAAHNANQQAVELVRQSLKAGGGGSLGLLEKLEARDLMVVSGHYDRVETVFGLLKIEFEKTDVHSADKVSFRKRRAVFVNCTNEAPSSRVVSRIRDYVENGGYLITSDWGVENVLKRAFPGFVEPLVKRGRNVLTADEVIGVRAAGGKERHFVLAGTALGKGAAKWWLEESSYPFRVLKPGSVEVLIESDDLNKRYGSRYVAVTFRFGKGRVFHMLGHFFQKEGNLKGTFSAQRLIANLLIAAVRGK